MTRLWILLLFPVLLNGCFRRDPPVQLTAPVTPILTSQTLWAVVNKSYLKVLNNASKVSPVILLMRKGDVAEIMSRIGQPEGDDYWVQIRLPESDIQGWVSNSDIDVYQSAIQARTAGQGLSSAMQ